jgi:hypothetical protein
MGRFNYTLRTLLAAVAAVGIGAALVPAAVLAAPKGKGFEFVRIDAWKGASPHFSYNNGDGQFNLNSKGTGEALYVFEGTQASDGLHYIGPETIVLLDPKEANRQYKGHAYLATDFTDSWIIFFGDEKIGVNPKGEDIYLLAYTFQDIRGLADKNGIAWTRWRTKSGTTRRTVK